MLIKPLPVWIVLGANLLEHNKSLNLNQIGFVKNLHIRVIPKVTQLGGENDQFQHNRPSNA
jgi:hypothetical protein